MKLITKITEILKNNFDEIDDTDIPKEEIEHYYYRIAEQILMVIEKNK